MTIAGIPLFFHILHNFFSLHCKRRNLHTVLVSLTSPKTALACQAMDKGALKVSRITWHWNIGSGSFHSSGSGMRHLSGPIFVWHLWHHTWDFIPLILRPRDCVVVVLSYFYVCSHVLWFWKLNSFEERWSPKWQIWLRIRGCSHPHAHWYLSMTVFFAKH